jgi:Na+/H+ antiporter NhaA
MGGVFSLQRGGRAAKRVIFNVISGLVFGRAASLVQVCTTSVQWKIANRDFSKTAGLTPIFEVRIVIYDQKHF